MSQETTELLVAKYYEDAYKLSAKMGFHTIPEDVRENIAFAALERAARTFDTSRGTKFITYLYQIIRNALIVEYNRKQIYRKVVQIRENAAGVKEEEMVQKPKWWANVGTPEQGTTRSCGVLKESEHLDIFAIFSDEEWENFEKDFSFKQFLAELKTILTDKQNKILEIVMYPEIYHHEYEVQFNEVLPTPKLPMFAIGRLLGCSKQAIDQQLQKIGLKAKRLYKELNRI